MSHDQKPRPVPTVCVPWEALTRFHQDCNCKRSSPVSGRKELDKHMDCHSTVTLRSSILSHVMTVTPEKGQKCTQARDQKQSLWRSTHTKWGLCFMFRPMFHQHNFSLGVDLRLKPSKNYIGNSVYKSQINTLLPFIPLTIWTTKDVVRVRLLGVELGIAPLLLDTALGYWNLKLNKILYCSCPGPWE